MRCRDWINMLKLSKELRELSIERMRSENSKPYFPFQKYQLLIPIFAYPLSLKYMTVESFDNIQEVKALIKNTFFSQDKTIFDFLAVYILNKRKIGLRLTYDKTMIVYYLTAY